MSKLYPYKFKNNKYILLEVTELCSVINIHLKKYRMHKLLANASLKTWFAFMGFYWFIHKYHNIYTHAHSILSITKN